MAHRRTSSPGSTSHRPEWRAHARCEGRRQAAGLDASSVNHLRHPFAESELGRLPSPTSNISRACSAPLKPVRPRPAKGGCSSGKARARAPRAGPLLLACLRASASAATPLSHPRAGSGTTRCRRQCPFRGRREMTGRLAPVRRPPDERAARCLAARIPHVRRPETGPMTTVRVAPERVPDAALCAALDLQVSGRAEVVGRRSIRAHLVRVGNKIREQNAVHPDTDRQNLAQPSSGPGRTRTFV